MGAHNLSCSDNTGTLCLFCLHSTRASDKLKLYINFSFSFSKQVLTPAFCAITALFWTAKKRMDHRVFGRCHSSLHRAHDSSGAQTAA